MRCTLESNVVDSTSVEICAFSTSSCPIEREDTRLGSVSIGRRLGSNGIVRIYAKTE